MTMTDGTANQPPPSSSLFPPAQDAIRPGWTAMTPRCDIGSKEQGRRRENHNEYRGGGGGNSCATLVRVGAPIGDIGYRCGCCCYCCTSLVLLGLIRVENGGGTTFLTFFILHRGFPPPIPPPPPSFYRPLPLHVLAEISLLLHLFPLLGP